ncbi:MAG: TatD family hydrolase [Planctomycetes bacterium]|nr:TatD family hydrolase [Planctomycetota bacterium]MCB9920081.1 TatD family hydrolase [Planctomycetota bacterium]
MVLSGTSDETLTVVDTHCHLGYDDEGLPPGDLVTRAQAVGVVALVDVGIDIATSRAALGRAHELPFVFASAGLHPNSCENWNDELDTIADLAADPSIVAIGETGLDLYWKHVALATQVASLEAHLELARRLDKPIILHCRDAFDELLPVLASHAPVRGVLHCFSGTVAHAKACLDLGLHVSFAGPLTYARNEALREAARFVPDDRVLVETDAPFLPPQSRRGKRNEPANVLEVQSRLAELRGRSTADMARICTRNAAQLFPGLAASVAAE